MTTTLNNVTLTAKVYHKMFHSDAAGDQLALARLSKDNRFTFTLTLEGEEFLDRRQVHASYAWNSELHCMKELVRGQLICAREDGYEDASKYPIRWNEETGFEIKIINLR